jgi:hypothetical protein
LLLITQLRNKEAKRDMALKILCTVVIIILSGGALYFIWTKEINMLKITPQSILAVLGILAVLFSVIKVFWPEIRLKVISSYYTVTEEGKGLIILKLQTISNVDLMLDNVAIRAIFNNDSALKMVPFTVRWKGVIFRMLDMKQQECDFKLLKPLEPDLRICGIKRGSNECYVCMKSVDAFNNYPIQSWTFELEYRHHLLPIPNLPWLGKKTLIVTPPEGKDLYFDDSLFQKITPEERQMIIDAL